MQRAKIVAQSASRALGLLISKDKVVGGMPFECFTQCYSATVQSILLIIVLQFGARNLWLVLMLFKIALAVISWDLADINQMLLLMVTWVSYPPSIVNGCALQKNGAD